MTTFEPYAVLALLIILSLVLLHLEIVRIKNTLNAIDHVANEKFIDHEDMLKAHSSHFYKLEQSFTDLLKAQLNEGIKLTQLETEQENMRDDVEADRLKITELDLTIDRIASQPIIKGEKE
jgi:hypothetical protein